MATTIGGYTKRYALTSYRKFSFKDNNALWKARRQASNERFYTAQYMATNAFGVSTASSARKVQLTMQAVATRFQKELSAKAAERMKSLDQIYAKLDKSV